MQSFSKPVSLSLILLWTHERGEFSNKVIAAAAETPTGTLVDKAGAVVDTSAADLDASKVFGVHMTNGQVYWAHSIFNDLYIRWSDGTPAENKQAVMDHLMTSFLVIKTK